jgi:hypothetical protein
MKLDFITTMSICVLLLTLFICQFEDVAKRYKEQREVEALRLSLYKDSYQSNY